MIDQADKQAANNKPTTDQKAESILTKQLIRKENNIENTLVGWCR
jgi:hypothetical protein